MAMSQPQEQGQESLVMTEAEYLEFESKSEIKHEFVAGKVYSMAGAGWNHNIINGNIQTILNSQLAGKPCVVVSSDMRLKVASSSVSFRYPDTMVVCGEPDFTDDRSDTVSNPVIIIEVLSPSSVVRDYNEKLAEYTGIESLHAYVLVSPNEVKVEVFSREIPGEWVYSLVTGLDGTVALSSINCEIHLERLYDKVTLKAPDSD